MVTLPHSCGQSAQLFDPFFEQVGSHQCLPVGFPGLGEFAVAGIIILQPSLWDLLSVVGALSLMSFGHGSTLPSLEVLFHGGQEVLG